MRQFIGAISILTICLTFTACTKEKTEMGYITLFPWGDSTRVEWLEQGSTQWQSTGLPENPSHSNEVYIVQMKFDIDLDGVEASPPMQIFDSLFVYRHLNGQDSLVYSGVQDSDWTLRGESNRKSSGIEYALMPVQP